MKLTYETLGACGVCAGRRPINQLGFCKKHQLSRCVHCGTRTALGRAYCKACLVAVRSIKKRLRGDGVTPANAAR